jgi:hypothetical protein
MAWRLPSDKLSNRTHSKESQLLTEIGRLYVKEQLHDYHSTWVTMRNAPWVLSRIAYLSEEAMPYMNYEVLSNLNGLCLFKIECPDHLGPWSMYVVKGGLMALIDAMELKLLKFNILDKKRLIRRSVPFVQIRFEIKYQQN